MHVRFMGPTGLEEYAACDIEALLSRVDGLTWVDVPALEPRPRRCCASGSTAIRP